MHKIYRPTQRFLVAQILAIELGPQAKPDAEAHTPTVLLKTDSDETFAVDVAWARDHGVQVGGYLALTSAGGDAQAYFIQADQLATQFELVGEATAPAPESNAAAVTYDFDQFVEYGIKAGGNVVEGMPGSFTFHGHPVTHENNDCYLISQKESIEPLYFERGDLVVVTEDGGISLRKSVEMDSIDAAIQLDVERGAKG
jgi:hypothetical protein